MAMSHGHPLEINLIFFICQPIEWKRNEESRGQHEANSSTGVVHHCQGSEQRQRDYPQALTLGLCGT
jgi:hypothetical protein